MIEVVLIVVAAVAVLIALVRDPDDAPPPAQMESGATHLRADHPPRQRRRRQP